ncbi:phage antirepressor KilAC domain-containing protein [Aquirufa nivalisilvae]|uniref:phage antirepressor KilAC domain-containing protein n=1 Tax=Aquirufa TaxID=2676247 RepID=UPI0022A9E638|nr:phage antirepressor KilAC domain-containing protein [Aquirufa nivalisilvae]MCZ2480048.1 hypothetical protein [Aquirufa nivalisilvae]
MQELIKISTNDQGSNVVSARELYSFFEVKSDFSHWAKRMLAYGFIEGQDFLNSVKKDEVQIEGGREVKRDLIDYAFTINTAKEIAMLQRSEKGKQARQYFIECERVAKASSVAQVRLPTAKELALLLIESENAKEELQHENSLLAEKVQLQNEEITKAAPRVQYYKEVLQSNSLIQTTIIAKDLGMSAVSLNKKLNDLGIIYRVGGTWLLKAKYSTMGLAGTRTFNFKDSEGRDKTSIQLAWTEKGRAFIHKMLNPIFTPKDTSINHSQFAHA